MPRDLGDIVRRLHGLDAAALAEASLQAERSGTDLGEVLRARQLLSEAQLLEAVAELRGLPYLDRVDERLDPELARALPATRSLELRAVPVGVVRGELVLATCERSHAGKEAALGRLLGQPVQLCLAPRSVIEACFDALYTSGRAGPVARAQQLPLGFARDDDEHPTQVDDALAGLVRAELDDPLVAPLTAADDAPDLFVPPSPTAGAPPVERTLVLSLSDVVDADARSEDDAEVIEEVLELIEVVDDDEDAAPPEPQIGRGAAWYDSSGKTQIMRMPSRRAAARTLQDDEPGEPFGEYRLLRCIGVGGMAEVFEARRTMAAGLTRQVAVKRILPSYSKDAQFVTMFLDEARITAQLSHPAIGQVLDVGKVGDEYFIAMEYLHGRNLEAITKHARQRDLPIPLPVAVYVVQQVLEGLDHAHRKRDPEGRSLDLVHRDVSPANVICCYEGGVKLIDFGIARAAGRVSQTRAGLIRGKVCYMSPEQLREQPVDHRSDIFAAGVLLWELLAGRSLFGGANDRETIANIARVVVPPLRSLQPQVPPELAAVVHQALQREPGDRPAWAADMSEALRQVMGWPGDGEGRALLAEFMRAHFA